MAIYFDAFVLEVTFENWWYASAIIRKIETNSMKKESLQLIKILLNIVIYFKKDIFNFYIYYGHN